MIRCVTLRPGLVGILASMAPVAIVVVVSGCHNSVAPTAAPHEDAAAAGSPGGEGGAGGAGLPGEGRDGSPGSVPDAASIGGAAPDGPTGQPTGAGGLPPGGSRRRRPPAPAGGVVAHGAAPAPPATRLAGRP